MIIGMQGGTKAELDINKLLRKRARMIATSLRGRAGGRQGRDRSGGARARLADARRRRVRPIVHATVPMSEAAEAHGLFEAGGVIGKVLLTVRPTVGQTAKEESESRAGQNGEQQVMVVGPDGRPVGMARVPSRGR